MGMSSGATANRRLQSLDFLRGLLMIIRVLNHVCDSRITGTLWFSIANFTTTSLPWEVIDTISVGLVLFRLQKGSRLEFEQTRVNDEIWLPRREHVYASARMGLMLKGRLDSETTFENYRKFQSDSRLLGGTENH